MIKSCLSTFEIKCPWIWGYHVHQFLSVAICLAGRTENVNIAPSKRLLPTIISWLSIIKQSYHKYAHSVLIPCLRLLCYRKQRQHLFSTSIWFFWYVLAKYLWLLSYEFSLHSAKVHFSQVLRFLHDFVHFFPINVTSETATTLRHISHGLVHFGLE